MAATSEALFQPQAYVQKAFSKAEDPADAISNVQDENQVKLPSFQAAAPLLDLHGLQREEIYQSLFDRLKGRLEERIEALDQRGVRKLMEKSFRFVTIPELRGVVMTLLDALPAIEDRYLLEIAEKEELYHNSPTGVKRQIWQLNPGVFGEAVSPLLDQYIAQKETIAYMAFDTWRETPAFFNMQPRQRRQSPVLKQLMEMLGSSEILYKTLCQFLRTLFLRTGISHYCTLRADLTMLLHEQDNEIMDSDRCHKFAWCLDACIRVGGVDEKKLRELYSFLDTIEGGDEILEDVSMLLRDPYALNSICRSVLSTLQKLKTEQKLPRDSRPLENLLRLLSIGLKSMQYLESKSYTGDPLEPELVVQFLPDILSMLVENDIKNACTKMKQDHTHFTPSEDFVSQLVNVPSALHIACTYALLLTERKLLRTLCHLLPAIEDAYTQSTAQDLPVGFLHSMSVGLAQQLEGMKEGHVQAILLGFWLPCAQHSEAALLYCCQLLRAGHGKIKLDIIHKVVEGISPSDSVSAETRLHYQTLLAHLDNSQTLD